MDQNQNQGGQSLTAQSVKSPQGSLREQSLSTLQAAIHSPAEPGETLKRANTCLALYFDPDNDPETKAAMRESFVRALAHVPTWAMHRAFDGWERRHSRRPSPGEIVILAEEEIKAIRDEIKGRLPPPPELTYQRVQNPVGPERAKAILEEAGFTPKRMQAVRSAPMATTYAEAETKAAAPRKPHWSETAAPDDPRWEMLRRSRAASTVVSSQEAAE